ncbi:MAG: lipopolysaccharide biosynthesis protein [Lachnospiraceae bacterium]|nr:lipopolysaccharide biosynthesis protein [Lachnospiraceae bacterium]
MTELKETQQRETAERGTKAQVLNGLFWKVMENGGSQGIQFIISILLARLLSPDEYGIINIVLIFVTIANVIVQNGFGTALIQKQQADERDYSSVFFVNLAAASVIYGVLFLAAPWIAVFYENPEMTAIVRVLSLVLFPGAVISVQTAFVSRQMKFKGLCISTVTASLVSGAAGVFMAGRGFGVWALVGQQVGYYLALVCVLFFAVSWRPKLLFAMERVESMFRFGWKLLCASLIDTLFMNLYGLVVGKIYDERTMGIYSRGEQFPKLIVTNLGTAIQSVMLPALSAHQNHPEQVVSMLRRAIQTSVFLVLPMMAGLAAAADNLVLVLLGEKWMACVPFLQISCLAYAVWPMDIANLQALNAMGRSDVFLKLEIIKKIVGVAILALSIRCGALTFIAWKAAGDFLCTFINAWPNQKLLGYHIGQMWRDILPSLLVSLFMGAGVYLLRFALPVGIIGLAGQVVFGVVIYVALAWILKLESLRYLWNVVKERRSTKIS